MATIRKRKDGSYDIAVTVRYHSRWVPPEGIDEADQLQLVNQQAALFEAQCQQEQLRITGSNVKFRIFTEDWFAHIAPAQCKTRTIIEYKRYAKRAYAEFGEIPINMITKQTLQSYVIHLQEQKDPRTDSPISAKTVKNYILFVSSVFSYAVKTGLLQHNPCHDLFLPKVRKKEPRILEKQEAVRFLDLLLHEPDVPMKYRVFFTLAIFNGFREGELLALEWHRDIDFENSIININKASIYLKKDGIRSFLDDDPKTEKSKRSAKQPEFIMELLRSFRLDQMEQRCHFNGEWKDCDRLFLNDRGQPLVPSAPLRWLQRFLKRHNFPNVNVHSLQHFFASALITSGIDVKTVSELLGHSSTTTTLGIYAHSFQVARAKAMPTLVKCFPEEICNINPIR